MIINHNESTTPTIKSISWIPVLNGETYCSPACGIGCKHEAYLQAVKNADNLASELGYGWEPEVWENCGWHYRAKKNSACVDVFHRGDTGIEYTATIRIDFPTVMVQQIYLKQESSDPVLAVKLLDQSVLEVLKQISAAKFTLAIENKEIESCL